MAAVTSATPLVALDAVVIDTETTGLDPAKARIVEIAAVRLAGGRLAPEHFRRLVRPGIPIPPTASAIHGIDDAAVAAASSFRDVWADFSPLLRNNVVIGHTLGFDLAVLQRECERAGQAWTPPRALDTRLLAEIAEPHLAGYTIEKLAAWLEVEIVDRHSAAGDALTTARIFQALVPKLRDSGIRTFAEALQGCRALMEALDGQHRAGWTSTIAHSAADAEGALKRIDSYPYRHRIGEIMSSPAQFAAPDVAVGEALSRMMKERISSLFVVRTGDDGPVASETGIVTERDLLRAVADHAAAALAMPVERFASRPLAAVPADAFVHRAIGRMNRLKIRHLGVVDDADRVVGALSARDLLRLRAGEAIVLGDEIDQAEDVHALASAWAKLPQIAFALVAEGVGARNVAAVISRELSALTHQAVAIAERRMADAGQGSPPTPYSFAILGSAGRGESLLAMDQDNALVFTEGEPGGPEDRWFETLATQVAQILHEVGVPYCKGGVMAKNPAWRGSMRTWRTRIDDWIERSNPQDLLAVDIFFDLRDAHGDAALADTLWRAGFDAARGKAGFGKLLAEASGQVEPGLGLFGGFKTKQGRINLKKAGLFGIVTTARVLAICHHVVERSTPARLAGVKALGLGAEHDLDALADAHGVFLDCILGQQIEDIEHGLPPTNAVMVKRLGKRERERLRDALEAVRHLDDVTRDLLFKN